MKKLIRIIKKGAIRKPKYKSPNGQNSLSIIGPSIVMYSASQIPNAVTSMTSFF